MSSYDVVVVGAGIVGSATAAAVAAAGLSVAVISEWGARAVSATAVSGGLVRCYEPDPRRRALALRSHELLWRRAGRRALTGHQVTGSLVCLTETEADQAAPVLAELAGHGVRAELLGRRQIASRWPSIGTGGIVAALWEPAGGYADPSCTAALLRNEARRHGAVMLADRVRSLVLDGDRVRGVATARATLTSGAVVLAAGCGSHQLLPPGLRHGLATRRIRYALVDWPHRPLPTVMDHGTGMWARPYGAGTLLVGRPVDDWGVRPGVGTDISQAQLAFIRDGGRSRWPGIGTAPLRGARWGTDLYHAAGPLLGPADGVPGLVLATAWSGGGFKTAPAAGEAVAAAILRGDHDVVGVRGGRLAPTTS